MPRRQGARWAKPATSTPAARPSLDHLDQLGERLIEQRRMAGAGITAGWSVERQVEGTAGLLRAFRQAELAEVDRLRSLGIPWPALAPLYDVGSGQAVQQRISRLRQSLSGA